MSIKRVSKSFRDGDWKVNSGQILFDATFNSVRLSTFLSLYRPATGRSLQLDREIRSAILEFRRLRRQKHRQNIRFASHAFAPDNEPEIVRDTILETKRA